MVLRDKDIRDPLFEHLEDCYGKARILEEIVIGRARADAIMVTEKALYGIEIKSDADTYARLATQVKYYDQFFDYNMVVVGSTHAAHVGEHIPDYWGILSVEQMEAGLDFYWLRKPENNPKLKLKQKLTLLWRPELVQLQEWNGMPAYKQKSKRFVQQKILERVPEKLLEEELARQISECLFERDYNRIEETILEYKGKK